MLCFRFNEAQRSQLKAVGAQPRGKLLCCATISFSGCWEAVAQGAFLHLVKYRTSARGQHSCERWAELSTVRI